MLTDKENFRKFTDLSKESRKNEYELFPFWDENTLYAYVKVANIVTDLKLGTHFTATTYEEAKKMNSFKIFISEDQWASILGAATEEDLKEAYLYIRRRSILIQSYDPYNYKTPSPQDIAKSMDKIVGMIQDTAADISEQSASTDNLVTINLTRDTISIPRKQDGSLDLTNAFSCWSITNAKGDNVTDKYTCGAQSSTPTLVILKDEAERKITVESWNPSSSENSASITLTFTKIAPTPSELKNDDEEEEEGEDLIFRKTIAVTIVESGEDGEMYVLEVISSIGTIKIGQTAKEIKLTARIYRNGQEIATDAYGFWYFTWIRDSNQAEEDKKWNDIYKEKRGQCTAEDNSSNFKRKAVYSCSAVLT